MTSFVPVSALEVLCAGTRGDPGNEAQLSGAVLAGNSLSMRTAWFAGCTSCSEVEMVRVMAWGGGVESEGEEVPQRRPPSGLGPGGWGV